MHSVEHIHGYILNGAHINNLIQYACTELTDEKAMKIGKKYLDYALKKKYTGERMTASAINMLIIFKNVEQAEDLFAKMKRCDINSYGVMLKRYNLNNHPNKSLALFSQIQHRNMIINEAI